MPGRPNFQSLQIQGTHLIALGHSDENPLPVAIHVFVEQDGNVADGNAEFKVDRVTTGWQATFGATGFTKGKDALAFGVEMRTQPFEASSWSQVIEIT